jgi:hypothetical protein
MRTPETFRKTDLREKYTQAALLLLSVGAFFGFGLHHLTQFVTADEHYWVYERIPQYWQAVQDHKWKKTLINDKPGVSVALVSGAGLLAEPHPEQHPIENNRKLDVYHADQTEKLYFAFRLPLLLFNTLFLFYIFWIVGKLTQNRWIALWTVMGIALSPILIGISQIINPDTLLWTFSVGAFFTFLTSLRYPTEKKYVALTAVFLGFAMLSKYTAAIFYPVFTLLSLLAFLTRSKQPTREQTAVLVKHQTLHMLAIILGSVAVVAALLPAAWARPKTFFELFVGFADIMPWVYACIALFWITALADALLLKGRTWQALYRLFHTPLFYLHLLFSFLAGGLFLVLIIGRNVWNTSWQLFNAIPFDAKEIEYLRYYNYIPNFFENILLSFNPLTFSLPPLILAFILLLWVRQFNTRTKPFFFFLNLSIILFLFLFFLGNLLSGILITVRYSIPLYPLMALLAALGLWGTIDPLAQKFKKRAHALLLFTSLAFFVILSASVISASPFYFNYTSNLLPKNKLINDAWGYGGYEAAQYINAQPDADQLVVWADYYGVCEFIKGICITSYNYTPGEYQVDYYVTTRRGNIRYGPDKPEWKRVTTIEPYKYYNRPDPVWELHIGNRPENYLRVYQVPKSGCDSHGEVCVGIITDIGACKNDTGSYESKFEPLGQFVNAVNTLRTSFNINLGDNANFGLRQCSESGTEDILWVKDRLSTKAHTHFVLGDHDISSDTALDARWRKLIKREQLYYSFDVKDVHVVVLDTVLGGDTMRATCSEDPVCSEYERQAEFFKQLLKDPTKQKQYLQENNLTLATLLVQKKKTSQLLTTEQDIIKNTRSEGRRDKGRVGEEQLRWLEEDLRSSTKQKVLVFSDHPLFRFQSHRKLYDITNRSAVQKILEESGKQVVTIAGEAHLWHEEIINGVHYYIVDEFSQKNAWAFFKWDQNGFSIEKMQGGTVLKTD